MRVLIVDDSPTVIHRVSRVLESAGITVAYTQLARFRGFCDHVEADLVLLDVNLIDGAKGTDGLVEFVEGESRPKIYLHSTMEPLDLYVMARHHAIDGWIEKGGDDADLLSAVLAGLRR